MKKTAQKKALVIRKETLKTLASEELYEARGGGVYNDRCTAGFSGCSTVWAFKCSHAK